MIMITDPGIVTQTHRRGAAPGPGRPAGGPAGPGVRLGVTESVSRSSRLAAARAHCVRLRVLRD